MIRESYYPSKRRSTSIVFFKLSSDKNYYIKLILSIMKINFDWLTVFSAAYHGRSSTFVLIHGSINLFDER